MRSIFALSLATFLSLLSISAGSAPTHFQHIATSEQNLVLCHPEGAFVPGTCVGSKCVTEGSRSSCRRFFASLGMTTQTSITVEAYWEMVGNTRQALTKMEALPVAEITRQLDELASEWEKVTAVEFPDQRVVIVDPSYLAAELRTTPPDLKRLGNLLDVLLQAHVQYPQEVFTIQDIESLKEILARPEFQWSTQAVEGPDWFQRILDAFFNFLERVAFGVQNTVYYGRVPLMIGAALLLILSLFYISRNLSRSLVREAEIAAQGGEDDSMLTSKGALQRAQTLSNQGDYRNAIRYLYLSSLLVLDERGLMRYDRSRTNREYLRSVSSKPELENPLHSVIDVFDRVWYGFESVDEQTYQSYLQHVDELREKKE